MSPRPSALQFSAFKTVFVIFVTSMLRAAVKLLLSDVRSQQSLSHPTAAEAGPPPKSGAGVGE
jgi:hypothetical protein